MDIKTRDDIKNIIVSMEKNFPVNNWKFNGFHLWPLIRLELFFYIRKKIWHQKKTVSNQNKPALNKQKTDGRIKAWANVCKEALEFKKTMKALSAKEFVFVGHNEHRVKYQDALYNRFFDALIDTNNLRDRIFFLEFGNRPLNELTGTKNIVSINRLVKNFKSFMLMKKKLGKKDDIKLELEGYQDFLDSYKNNEFYKNFFSKFSSEGLTTLLQDEYYPNYLLFTRVLKKIKPKRLFILCYYSDISMIAAANALNIETIDYQHGAQADAHLAYGSWSVLPENGYDFLPKTFWNWDSASRKTILDWSSNNSLYKSFVGGNSWVDYWKNKSTEYKHKDYILYTLQPDSIPMEQLFSPALIECIKDGKHKWLIRLHPRQIKEMDKIEEYLASKQILELVNIKDATYDPLPLLLKNCLLHVTNSSASTIEASLFQKKTVLIHDIGRLYYENLINEGLAFYINLDDDFETKFENVIEIVDSENNSSSEVNENVSWVFN